MFPEFMIRVKLPEASHFPSTPSGDLEYEEAWDNKLFETLPQGFEYVYPRTGEQWPKDSEGFTFARLICIDNQIALGATIERERHLRSRLDKITEAVKSLNRWM